MTLCLVIAEHHHSTHLRASGLNVCEVAQCTPNFRSSGWGAFGHGSEVGLKALWQLLGQMWKLDVGVNVSTP
jgi:hypothetical protein